MPQCEKTHNAPFFKGSFVVRPDQLDRIVEKEWGHEEWIVNKPAYCGKKLVFNKGFQCSMHQHKIKDETFYIQSGKIVLETDLQGFCEKRIMTAGDTVHIVPDMWHRITALTNAEVFEFSTFHREDDSYRRTSSGKADLKAMGIEEGE
jgi:quercetin dioxygenase-like cupin family protein